jgi:peroxiredoxin
MKKYLFILLTSVVVNATSYLSAKAAIISGDSTLLNKPAPKFELPGMDGKIYASEELKGKAVVLNFWFINCKPCVNEMPVLNGIRNSYDPRKVVFLALALDKKDAVNAFLKTHKFEYTVLPNAARVIEKYDLQAFPVSIVIDSSGIIRFIQVGGPNIGENLKAAIDEVTKSK